MFDADDFIRSSIQDPRQFVTWRNGYFQLDFVNLNEVVSNTVYVTSTPYTVTTNDYYIGVNVASSVVINLPLPSQIYTGREYYVKDESGMAGYSYRYIDVYPSGLDDDGLPVKIDGQDYVRLNINFGGLHFIYRNGWRVI